MVRVLSVTPTTMDVTFSSLSVPVPMDLADETTLNLSSDRPHPVEGERVNMTISVDISGILPEGLRNPRKGTFVFNLEKICIMTIKTGDQLQHLKVDSVKKSTQDLCWHCFHLGVLKRNFKLWLQTSPYDNPGFPYGRFSPVDFDLTWQEVLNIHQSPWDIRQIHLRAHHPE